VKIQRENGGVPGQAAWYSLEIFWSGSCLGQIRSGKISKKQNPNKSKQNLLISTEIRRFLARPNTLDAPAPQKRIMRNNLFSDDILHGYGVSFFLDYSGVMLYYIGKV